MLEAGDHSHGVDSFTTIVASVSFLHMVNCLKRLH